MGAAAEFRGNKMIREQLVNQYPQEFAMMHELNSLKKNDNAGTPFKGKLAITHSKRLGWSIEDYVKRDRGYGFHGYKTLRDLVRQWNITIIGHDADGTWIAEPSRKYNDGVSFNLS